MLATLYVVVVFLLQQQQQDLKDRVNCAK